MKRIAFIVLCLLQVVSLKSQAFKAFSGDLTTFSEEIKQCFFQNRNVEKQEIADAEQITNDFLPGFYMLSESEQTDFVNLCNAALKANMRPFPMFKNLLKASTHFLNNGVFSENYQTYVKCLTEILENRKMRDFETLLNNINRLADEGFLYESLSAKWQIDGKSSFAYFDGKPCFTFEKTNLTCYAYNDSSRIHLTQGVFYPLTSSWQGMSGLVDYTRAGYDLSEMFIQLNAYEINLKTSRYKADSVYFFNKIYFKRPMFGRMEERIVSNVKTGQSNYPLFASYRESLIIEDIFEGVNFEGQYTQAGSHVKCGEQDDFAKLNFWQNKQIVLTVSAKNFTFGKDRISAPIAEVRIKLGDEEILHPTCEIRYDNAHRELSVLHPFQNAFKDPIYNSFHELDMYVEAMYWNIDSSQIDLRMLKIPNNEGIGIFESKYYFSAQDLQSLIQNIEYNPLYMLRKLSEERTSKNLDVQTIATSFRRDVVQTKGMLLRLASMGFLRYDAEKESVELQEKMFHYLQSAAKRSDYDVLKIISKRTNESYATLDLQTKDLKIFGVEKIILSHTQNVHIIPDNQTITVKKNRDFAFDGKIHSGKFDFIASKCYFDYDRFKILMDTVETMEFSVRYGEPDMYGQYQLKKIETTIEQLNGEISIDSASNKSGQERYREYPIFTSFADSYVSYEKPQTQNNVYKFDKFYYTIFPFRLENLNNFSTDSLRFDGYLTSAGIFPDLYEKLKVMPDFSLGFMLLSSDSALPVYQNQAKFYDTLRLSNDGLIGSGKLEFITSTNLSNRFIFMPDSLNATVQKFDIAEQTFAPVSVSDEVISNIFVSDSSNEVKKTLDVVRKNDDVQFPTTKAKIAKLHWEPYTNLFATNNTKEGFSVFDDEVTFFGEIRLFDTVMIGNGRAVFKNNTEMSSTHFVFKNRELISENVKFGIKSKDKNFTAVQSENYHVKIDLDKQRGYFRSNDSATFLGFPINQYLCYMNELEWDMVTNHVYLKNSQKSSYSDEELDQMNLRELIAIGKDLPGSDFISLHPKQDSITFNSPIAEYNLETNELNIMQVRIIYTADIAVQPTQGNIVIGKDASMKPFENANLLVNVEHQFHELHDATLSIQGRTKYTASGTYDYKDITGKIYPIFFEKIAPNRDGISVGTAKITPDDPYFALSPMFDFLGQVTLNAGDSLLDFSGSSKINQICREEEEEHWWFNFHAVIAPQNVKIPLSENLKERGGKRIGAGFYFNTQGDLLPQFFSSIRSSDKAVMQKTGDLFYDTLSKSYVIAPFEQIFDADKLTYNLTDCSLKTYGVPDFHLNLGRVGWDNFGTLYHLYNEYSTIFDGVIGMNFFFDEGALEMFYQGLERVDGSGAEQNVSKFTDYLRAHLSQDEAERLTKEINLYGSYRKLPTDFEKTILFSDVKMQWDEMSRSFVSLGKLGIASIGPTPLNKYVDGVLQIVKSRRGDEINLYVEISRREWYLFSYSDGLMQALSSNTEFNDAIASLKASKRRQRGKSGTGSYEFDLAPSRKRSDFMYKINAIKSGFEDSESENEELENNDYQENIDVDE